LFQASIVPSHKTASGHQTPFKGVIMPDTLHISDDEFEEVPLDESTSSPGFFTKGTGSIVPEASAGSGVNIEEKKKKSRDDQPPMCCNLM